MESGFPGFRFLPGSDSLSGIGRVTTPQRETRVIYLFVKIDYIAMMVGQVDNAQVGRPI